MADRVVRVRMVADIGDYQKKMKEASKSTSDLTGSASQTGRGLSDLAVKGALVAGSVVAVGRAVVNFTQDASRLQQSIGATQSVFQDASGTIDGFAENSVEAAGLSERAYRELASVAGAQLKSLGFSVDEAAKTADVLIRRGADLAATFGGTTEEAVSALGAAFRGEADPAERFGLRLNQTAVNAKAVEMGLAATTAEVDGNAKAQATLALILEQSADSMGQFSREADTLAGAQQRANAEWENAKASLGEGLLPIITDITRAFADLAGGAKDLEEKLYGPGGIFDTSKLKEVEEQAKAAENLGAGIGAAVAEMAASQDISAEASRRNAEAAERAAEQLDLMAEAIRGVTDATFAAIDSDYRYRRSLNQTADVVKTLRDGEGDLADEMLAAEGAVLAQADAAVQLAKDNAEAAGATFGAADEARVYRDELVKLKAKFPELAPVIDGYIAKLDAIPENVQTGVHANADLASVDRALAIMQDRANRGILVAPRPGQAIAMANGGLLDSAQVLDRFGDASVFTRPTILTGERQTGREAFVPEKGISRARAVGILGEAASWYGYGLAELANGGIVAPARMVPRDGILPPALYAGVGWKAMWAALRSAFPTVALYSAFRPGAITATGNPSYHGMGRAIDVSPRMDAFNWIAGNYPNSREVIFSPAGGRQIRNGGRHMYGEPTRGDHWSHVHWAMAKGGVRGNTTVNVTFSPQVSVSGVSGHEVAAALDSYARSGVFTSRVKAAMT